jgi:hypothetical protein
MGAYQNSSREPDLYSEINPTLLSSRIGIDKLSALETGFGTIVKI